MRFDNLLDSIKIARPCSADWNEMIGDDRRRFCGECRLNVYSLYGMTNNEVKDFLLASEGRLCVRLYERADGTMITENCPVGVAALRSRIRRVATAAVSVIASFLVGAGASRAINGPPPERPVFTSPVPEKEKGSTKISFGGMVSNLDEIKESILRDQREI